jgi:hypothetical protein
LQPLLVVVFRLVVVRRVALDLERGLQSGRRNQLEVFKFEVTVLATEVVGSDYLPDEYIGELRVTEAHHSLFDPCIQCVFATEGPSFPHAGHRAVVLCEKTCGE